MKIKQIKKAGPELYLVEYRTRWLNRKVERYVIAEPDEKILPFPEGGENCTITRITPVFYFRDNDELAHDCWHQIEWMVRHKIEFFDNTATRQGCKIVVEDSGTFINPAAALGNPHTHDPYPNIDLTGEPK